MLTCLSWSGYLHDEIKDERREGRMEEKVKGGRAGKTQKQEYLLSTGKGRKKKKKKTGHDKGRERKKAHKGWVVNPREPQSLVRSEQLKCRLPEVKVEAVVRRVSPQKMWRGYRNISRAWYSICSRRVWCRKSGGASYFLSFFFFFFCMSFCKIRWHRIVFQSNDPTLQHVFVWRNGLLQFIFVGI